MNVFSVLLTVCLVELCHCGDDATATKEALKGAVGGQQNSPNSVEESKQVVPPSQPTPEESAPLSARAKKVGPLFDVKESGDNGVFYLTCTPKKDKNPKRLVYEGVIVWDGKRKAQFLSALIYFNGDQPYLVTLHCRENRKDYTLFLHYNGDNWEHNRREYGRKLNMLKGIVPVVQPARQVNTIPITLDLSSLNESEIEIATREDRGVSHTTYSPKEGVLITSVVEGGAQLWATPEGEKLLFARVSTKGESSLLFISAKICGRVSKRYFEKLGGQWKKITEGNYDKKLDDLKNEPIEKHAEENGQSNDTSEDSPGEESPETESADLTSESEDSE
ncbi:signal peptide containing protein [Theileria equi strain WA]|uniref:Signal peptide containing protein n=1 Tax=Theileria equi strain WA TaxID=1537102 RepID=L1LDT3_THEEQ|nr:signal peptide containing protein [Theileria equi strain WA]EKX73516.1 signal peptide containing protein [Theileria equi strain WA]|eukprot:XP_004832968.1 signal peptide containing protein [Theileria equi strain WA]